MAPPKSKRAKRSNSTSQVNATQAESMSQILSPSLIEMLPKELIWQLLEYAPEAVLNLRRTSRPLRSFVDDFARSPSIAISLVDILEISHWDSENTERHGTIVAARNDRCLDIAMVAHPSKSRLYRLRLKLSQAPDGFLKRIRRQGSDGKMTLKVRPIDTGFVAHVGCCIGHRLGKYISLSNYPGMLAIPEVVSLIDGIKFTKLHVRHALTDDAMTHLLEMIRKKDVDEVRLIVKETGLTDPKSFLLELSSLVRSLYIHQNIVANINVDANYLFGLENEEWSRCVLEMFSRKIDKLRISNIYYQEYLSKSCEDMLRERLPELGKPIWFEATYPALYGLLEDRNDHDIHVGRESGDVCDWLRIKHRSRVNERFHQ